MGYLKYFGFFAGRGAGGFSMVGVLVMAGMMGGLALLLANLTKQQHFIQKTTETYFEVNALFDAIVRTLHDGEACKKTIGAGTTLAAGTTISTVKNKDGGVVFNTVDKYGNRLLRVESMTLRNPQISGTEGTVELEVAVLKLSQILKGYKKSIRKLPISVTVASGTSNLSECHHKIDNLNQVVVDSMTNQVTPLMDTKVNTAIAELCGIFGGVYANSQCASP